MKKQKNLKNWRNVDDKNMCVKATLVVFLCGIYMCSANPVPAPQSFTIGDDKLNWEALWNATKHHSDISRSGGDENIFDQIVRINAKERGSGIGRSDHNVFLFEGDIVMNKTDAIKIIQNNGRSRKTRAVIRTRRQQLWPQNVPYVIDSSLSRVIASIKNAIREWESTLPCLGAWQDVTRRRKPRDHMYFFRGGGCYSQVGRVGGAQRISIGSGCEHHGVVVHEIGHAMGLWHEQSRPDRDNYVTIFWNNIIPAMKFNFQKHSASRINSFGVSYDYSSVMHYGSYAFSRYRGRETIRSRPAGKRLGQRNGLSTKDKQQLRLLYGCTGTTKPTTRPNPSGCKADLQSNSNCQHWKGRGYCTKTYVTYMRKNCCKTCGVSVATCTDKDTSGNCPQWASSGFCSQRSRYYAYMRANCKKSCGLCT